MRLLLVIWALLDFCLLAAGVVCIVFSFVWAKPDVLINIFMTDFDLRIGLTLGLCLVTSFVLSVPAIFYRGGNSLGLKIFNWTLLANGIVVIVIGSCIWFFSLRQRQGFSELWSQASSKSKDEIQNMFSCCGYWNGTSAGQRADTTSFCADATFAATQIGCVDRLTAKSDYTLNNVFTTIYGFHAIVGALFIATICVINERKIDERFKRIDAKRGGSGFV